MALLLLAHFKASFFVLDVRLLPEAPGGKQESEDPTSPPPPGVAAGLLGEKNKAFVC